MHRVILLALGLCACTSQVRDGDTTFRTQDAPIYSSAAFDPVRLEGRWTQPIAFGTTSIGCEAGVIDFNGTGTEMTINGRLCLDGREQRVSGKVGPLGSGRLAIPGMEDWWVLWVDSGYRTLAVGTPSGAYGFILDRGTISPDRLDAAREIFGFNGYQPSALGPI